MPGMCLYVRLLFCFKHDGFSGRLFWKNGLKTHRHPGFIHHTQSPVDSEFDGVSRVVPLGGCVPDSIPAWKHLLITAGFAIGAVLLVL